MLIAFREGLNYRIESTFRDFVGHFLILKAVVQDSPVILINHYAPNDENSQARVLLEIELSLTLILNKIRLLFGGNFNLIFIPSLTVMAAILDLRFSTALSKLISVMFENELCDMFGVRNPDVKRFTYRVTQKSTPVCQSIKNRLLFYYFDVFGF